MKLNRTHDLLAYADDVNMLLDNINTITNIDTLNNASKRVGLEVNAEKTKYILLSHHQNAGQNHDIKMANRSFENMEQVKYFGMTVTNQNFRKKLRGERILVMLSTIQSRTFCPLVCCLET
jgi:hypothetical protein